MVRTHTISAPDDIWQQVFDYAEHKQTTISDITRQAWSLFFNKPKERYRRIDFVILILLLAIFSALLSLLSVVML